MTKLNTKSLFTIIILLLIGIVAVWRINQGPKKVEAGWWNESWMYRKAITLTNSGTGQTDVYVLLTIDTSDTTRFQADGGDIRFTKQNGELLPYYIVSGAGTASTVIHINFDIYPAGASTFYLYYGNSNADNGFSATDFTTAASNSSTNLLTEELSPAPIAYWSFNEGTGTTVYDSSPSQLDGKFYGDPTWKSGVDCISGNCLYFRGDKDGIEVSNNSKLNNTGATSIGMWIKPTTIDGSISLINRAGFTGPDNGYSLEIYDGKPSIIINNGRVSNSIQRCNQNISINNYYYLYWTRDESNNNKIYINGKECTYSSTIGITQVSTNTSLGIGSKLNKENLAPYSDYSNRNYNQMYDIGGWGGDDAEAYYYSSGGYNNLPYKKIIKTSGGTGGSFINDYAYFPIQDSRTYIVSAYIKASRNENLGAYTLDINREADNAYRTNGIGYNITDDWARYSWRYNSGIGHSGQYHARHIIYVDNDLPFETYWSGFKVEDVTGTGQTNPSYDFKGYIDEVKIYNYARTADQIKQDYNAGLAGISSMEGGSVNVGGTQVRNIKDNLVAHYKFDEGYGTIVNNFSSLGTTLNGTLGTGNSSPTWTTGKINKAIQFNNQNIAINMGNPLDLDMNTNNFTISSYYYGYDTQYNAIIEKRGTGLNGYLYIVNYPSPGNVSIFLNDGGSQKVHNFNNANLNNNTWYHLITTVNRENNEAKLFINGKHIQTLNISSTVGSISSNGNFRIGYDLGGGSFYGKLDEVKIYNTALTEEEIKLDYNQGSQFVMGQTNQTIGGTTTSLDYCIPGDTSVCSAPIAEWKFDEGIGETVFDISGNNYHGSLVNLPTWNIGKIGKSLKFSNNGQYVNMGSIPQLDQYTASAWIKSTNIEGSDSNYGSTIMATSNGYALWLSIINGEIRFYPFINTPDSNYGQTSGLNLNENQWYYITATASKNGNAKIYVNGQEKLSFDAGSIDWAGTFTIGDLRPGRGIWFDGFIDHIKIYDYIRTPAQIAYDYNKGAPVGWWKFDECEGTMINDWSGIGNTGTLVIGAGGSQVSVGTCSIGDTSAWSNGKTGKINSAMSFDGKDDWINVGNSDTYSYSDGNTFSMWIYGTGRFSEGATLLNRQGQSNPGFYWLMIYQNKGFLQYYNGSNNVNIMTTNVLPVSLNKWFHYVVTISGETVSFYVDGKFIESKQATNIQKNKITSNLYIGGYQNWTSNWQFPGLLDDVRIYNYALTAEQVKSVYNGGAVSFN